MSRHRFSPTAWIAVALALVVGYLGQQGYAAGTPANKVAASGAETEVFGPQTDIVLLSETIKINNPTDLILTASAECSIVTQVKTVGNATQTATATIRMWVTVDGVPVPVAAGDADRGRVVFCNRTHQQETKLDGDETDENDDYVRTFLDTREASAFSWMALNVGSGGSNIKKIELHATLEQQAGDPAATFSRAIVGNRTLILEPVKSAGREAVTPLN